MEQEESKAPWYIFQLPVHTFLPREVSTTMPRRKLNYRFHNPNPPAATADYIARLFVEVNTGKVETSIQEVAKEDHGTEVNPDCREERSA